MTTHVDKRSKDPSFDTGLWCLAAIAGHIGVQIDPVSLNREHGLPGRQLDEAELAIVAESHGLLLRRKRVRALRKAKVPFPFLARLKNNNCVIVEGCADNGGSVVVVDPLADEVEPILVPEAKFCHAWTGHAVSLVVDGSQDAIHGSGQSGDDGNDPAFGLRWFVPYLLGQRRILANIGLAVLALHGLALTIPIFIQVVIDKVLLHQAESTLYVLTIGVVIALVFDSVFVFLRRYLLLFASNAIDIEVATDTFGHLLSLPIAFFEKRSAGVLSKHMQQSQTVREFLTGKLFITILDSSILLILLPVLAFYSSELVLIVVGFAALIAAAIASLVVPYRRRLYALYRAEAERQAFLVETIHGMRTVKSMAVEPSHKDAWRGRSKDVVRMNFQVGRIASLVQALVGGLEKLMIVAVIGFGTQAVFAGALTVGALIAFQLLARRVSAPLVQLVTLVHEIQEAQLSLRMLGEVMTAEPERAYGNLGFRPAIRGHIEFDSVTFRYDNSGPPTLDGVSFTIPAGSIIGVVGRSGSGKTTLTRLMQGLYRVTDGAIRIDGYDIGELDMNHFRRHVGIVLQDSFLFRGTVAENISMAAADASFEDIVDAARMAGAEEFIRRLPRGYQTLLEEHAENLSGGQRQRLAIARALVSKPPILILDEATSALDPDSEAIITQSLRSIAAGRTVIVVSHRLSTLCDADTILVIDSGRIIASGAHQDLLSECLVYRQLWVQQARKYG